MNRKLIAAILATAAVAFSCAQKEESGNLVSDSLLSTTATIEDFVLDGAATKTTLSIVDNQAIFSFNDDDVLRVWPGDNSFGARFDVKENKGTSCIFTGNGFKLAEGTNYSAFYPGTASDYEKNAISVDYTGQKQSDICAVDFLYATDIVPASGACEFTMKHLGALLPIKVTFDEAATVTDLTLTSSGAPFITAGTVDLTASPVAVTGAAFAETVSLELDDVIETKAAGGIEVEAGQTVTFYMMIAPVEMSGKTITVALKNSTDVVMSAEVEGQNYEAGKAYVVNVKSDEPLGDPVDLSENETANTYIVSERGYYSFDATIAGNGRKVSWDTGIAAEAYPEYNARTGVKKFTGDGVAVTLNQNNCVSDVSYADGRILFKATGNEGNAKLTLTSGGAYVWTWVIWCTDTPAVIPFSYEGITYSLMDRNLGATANGSVLPNSIEEVAGLYYQFGNPIGYTWDEFLNGICEESRNTAATMKSALADNPNSPNLNVTGRPAASGATADWYWFYVYNSSKAHAVMGKMWGGGGNFDESLVCGFESTKTLYDPCPAGYKVMGWDTFFGYDYVSSGNAFGVYVPADEGDLFIPYNGFAFSNSFGNYWQGRGPYPVTLDGVGGPYASLWTSGANARNVAYAFAWVARDTSRGVFTTEGLSDGTSHIVSRGLGVRCVLEDDYGL